MFIVHVVRQFHPGVGGLENHVLDLASAQVAAGNRVRVVTLNRLFNCANAETLAARDSLHGIEIVRVPFVGSTRYPIALSVLRHVKSADVVHVHAIDFLFDYLAWTKPIHGRTLVASTHGGFFHTRYAARLKRLWFTTVTRLSCKFYAAVIAVSASDFERFRQVRPTGMMFIEQGVNIAKLHDAAAREFRKSIITIGRFAQNKRLDLVIEFMRALLRQDPEWTLTIAGRPGDLTVEDVMALVRHAGLDGAINVAVRPSDTALRRLVHESAFLASASEYEGFGITPIEGLSAGLLPLLSEIPPFRRLVTRTGLGLTVDFADPDKAARHLLQNVGRISAGYVEQRTACIKAAGAYDWGRVCERHIGLYRAAIGRDVRAIFDVPVRVLTFDEAVRLIDACYERRQRIALAFANAHTLNLAAKTPDMHRALQEAVVLNDGLGVDIASNVLYGSTFPENLNGTDFVPNYLRQTKHRFRLFLLGAKLDVAERAAGRLHAFCPQHEIAGCHDGYFDAGSLPEITEMIRASRADVVLVAMGNPRQELLIHDHLAATGCVIGIGVGALFDFLAGEVPRAAQWVRRWRLEWAYRYLLEPKRLAARYVIGNPLFLLRTLKQWWSGSRVADINSESKQTVREKSSAIIDRSILIPADADHRQGEPLQGTPRVERNDNVDEENIAA